jgi:alpha-D-ribose 1-methylphosphonate 5-triphosphate synthase subunit PhnH
MIKEISYDEVFDAQLHFRTLLDATARPGSVFQFSEIDIFPPEGVYKSTVFLCLALMNKDVKCKAIGLNTAALESYLNINTGVIIADNPSDAYFIIGDGNTTPPESLEQVHTGSPEFPEEGAFVILQVEDIQHTPFAGALGITLSGPGIQHSCDLYIKGLTTPLLEKIQDINTGFPLGIDTFLCGKNNQSVSIPRSTKIEWINHQQ